MPSSQFSHMVPARPQTARNGLSAHWLAPGLELLLLLMGLFLAHPALGEQRFPPPDFAETRHQIPLTTTPAPRATGLVYLDVVVLAAALGAAVWLAHKKRSRKGLVALSVFSLLYFGFWRKGCICSIGSVQNIVLGVFDSTYAVPLTVLVFFLLPLLVALFFGRAFCAGVCPHGALQDLVLLKPLKLPVWLEQALSLVPFFYLGTGVLFAATGSAFLFCEYDPFVPLFRLSGRLSMVLAGAGLLLIGVFIGRPFCRFLCPYGALLKLGAWVAQWRVRVTPDTCTQCRLCEAACPFDAIHRPEAGPASEAAALARDRRRLTLLLLLLPLLIVLGAWLGGRLSASASRLHRQVQLAENVIRQRSGHQPPDKVIDALSPDQIKAVFQQASSVRQHFLLGSRLLGGWMGLIVGLKLITLSIYRRRTDYEPDRGDCVACARCFDSCPNELVRRGLIAAPGTPQTSAGGPLPS